MNFVYITTNLINGKKYLGKHNGKNTRYLGSGKLLTDAIKKYGKENFKLEVVKECDSEHEAYLLEKELSILWDVVNNENWYNLKVGGEGFSSGELHPQFNLPKTEKHRKKLSESNLGKRRTEQQKKNQSCKMIGENNPCFGLTGENHPAYGHKKTSEVKSKISEAQKGRIRTVTEIEKFKISRKGKGMGERNSMSLEENRKKVSDAKKGFKRVYRDDGTYYMAKPTSINGVNFGHQSILE